MKKFYSLFVLILSLSVTAFAQAESDKTIDFHPNQPAGNLLKAENGRLVPTDLKGVELVEISIAGKAIAPGEPFAAGDDWVKGLKIKLKNVSGKTISSVRISITQPELKYKEGALGFSLAFGRLSPTGDSRRMDKIVQPGEEFELSQSEREYLDNQSFIARTVGAARVRRLRLGITMVQFEDGNLLGTQKLQRAK